MRTSGYQPKHLAVPTQKRSEAPARTETQVAPKVGHTEASDFVGGPTPAGETTEKPVAPTVRKSFGSAFKDMFLKPKNAIGMGLAGAVAAVMAFPVMGPAAVAVGGLAVVGLGLLGAIGTFIQDQSDFRNPKPPEA